VITVQWMSQGLGNHDHDFELLGHHTAEVMGVEAVVTTIPEPMGLRTYGMCRMFHFCVAIPPLLSPVLTNARDLGPLVSAWVWPAHDAGMKHRAQWAAVGRGG
jgi:glycerol uptake facilitator-like aquaporin